MNKFHMLLLLLVISATSIVFAQEVVHDLKDPFATTVVNEEFRKLNTVYSQFKDVTGMTGTCLAATDLIIENGLVVSCS